MKTKSIEPEHVYTIWYFVNYHDPFHIRTPYILYLLKDFQFLYLIVERDIILKNFYSLCKGLYKDF